MTGSEPKSGTMWGGRFSGGLDPEFAAFNRSLPFDHRLLAADVQGSIAWARALTRAGVLTERELTELEPALAQVANADPSDSDQEDIHSFVEHALGELCGDLAKKLHTGRSRNDQVATDMRLYLRDQITRLQQAICKLSRSLVDLADRYADLPIPGYTHAQRAQPITVGHHALAYVEMLARDHSRLEDCARRMNSCPLGSAALAGTTFDVDREAIATELGFAGPTRNSLDSVSDRDHQLELGFACTTVMLHLSRLSEDWIFFATYEAGFLEFSDNVATGSSLLPQKKNPDAMELIRGKSGRVVGALQSLIVVLKGLPLAYNKDMQEDKEVLFDSIETTASCLSIASTAVEGATFREDRCRAAATTGYLSATDVADLLVARGVPFRVAHERTGQAVQRAIELGVELDQLSSDEQASLFPELTEPLAPELTTDKVLSRRDSIGGTAPQRVRSEVAAWIERLESWAK